MSRADPVRAPPPLGGSSSRRPPPGYALNGRCGASVMESHAREAGGRGKPDYEPGMHAFSSAGSTARPDGPSDVVILDGASTAPAHDRLYGWAARSAAVHGLAGLAEGPFRKLGVIVRARLPIEVGPLSALGQRTVHRAAGRPMQHQVRRTHLGERVEHVAPRMCLEPCEVTGVVVNKPIHHTPHSGGPTGVAPARLCNQFPMPSTLQRPASHLGVSFGYAQWIRHATVPKARTSAEGLGATMSGREAHRSGSDTSSRGPRGPSPSAHVDGVVRPAS